jgi:hypothetical protein
LQRFELTLQVLFQRGLLTGGVLESGLECADHRHLFELAGDMC